MILPQAQQRNGESGDDEQDRSLSSRQTPKSEDDERRIINKDKGHSYYDRSRSPSLLPYHATSRHNTLPRHVRMSESEYSSTITGLPLIKADPSSEANHVQAHEHVQTTATVDPSIPSPYLALFVCHMYPLHLVEAMQT